MSKYMHFIKLKHLIFANGGSTLLGSTASASSNFLLDLLFSRMNRDQQPATPINHRVIITSTSYKWTTCTREIYPAHAWTHTRVYYS
jgi:hypothetical protein